MATFNGTGAPDGFSGGSDDDTAYGNGGNDSLSGNGGSDVLAGNGDSDTLDGGDDDDWLYSADQSPAFTRPYFDEFNGPYTPPILDTGTAVDSLLGGGGDDHLFAGYGDNVDGGADTFTGDYLYISFLGASAGVDFDFRLASQTVGGGTIANVENLAWLQGSNHDDDFNLGGPSAASSDRTIVFAMAGNDTIVAGLHTGFIDGGDGNDLIDGRLSNQLGSVRGGAGDDILYDSALTLAEVLGGDGNDTITAHWSVSGGNGNDSILVQGNAVAFVNGDAGDDDITGNDRGDYISGGTGADVLRGGAANDDIASDESRPTSFLPNYDSGTERDVVTAGAGNDLVAIGYGDDADGGADIDRLRLSVFGSPTGVTLNTANILSGQPYVLGGGTIQNFERLDYIQGSAFSDIFNIATQAGTVTIEAGDGNDQVRSNGGQVDVLGGNGNDTFFSGTGADLFNGGAGNDTVDYLHYMTGVTATLTPPPGALQGRGPDGDVLGNVENISGSNQADSLTGDGNDNVLNGRGGNDTLDGRGGQDFLNGGSGADSMTGGTGNDIYFVDDSGDVVTEQAFEGQDQIRTSLAVFSLVGHANVEDLAADSNIDHDFRGSSVDNFLFGGIGNDTLRLYDGGNDTVYGWAGNDNIFFIGTLNGNDFVKGGEGTDTLILQGDYSAGLVLTANVTQIENISILGGGNTNFGDPGTNQYDYSITLHDANFAAGVQARINGSALLAGEDFVFDGSAETDAKLVVYGGRGKDTLTGGQSFDIFFFAEGRFATGDTVNGSGGYDGMFLRGNYTIDFNAPGYTGLFTNIENLTLTSATDERYARGGGTEFDYNLVLSDAIVKPGETLTVSGTILMASETMILDASQETDGMLRLFGGKANDILKGGALADLIHGNLGADMLTGNGGADSFRYQAVAESDAANMDRILDFTAGTDSIDLSRIDANTAAAGDQGFSWIGSNAFSGTAGELRTYGDGTAWFVEGDVDGDSVADLVISITLQDATPLSAADFLL